MIKEKLQKNKKSNLIARSFYDGLKYVHNSRKYIYFIIWTFVLFAVIGLVLPAPASLDSYIKEVLKQIVEKTSGLNAFELIGFILLNNFLVSGLGILFGVIFCFVPFFVSVSNGYILGYVIRTLFVKMGLAEGGTYLWRVLPHGIFELPAVMISLGIGIRLGISFFGSLNKNSFKSFFINFKNALKVLFFVVLPLLVIAAIIEGSLIKSLGG